MTESLVVRTDVGMTARLATAIAEVPGPVMLGLKEIYVRGTTAVIGPTLAAEDDIAGSQEHDLAGLGDRFGAVSLRNKGQISRD